MNTATPVRRFAMLCRVHRAGGTIDFTHLTRPLSSPSHIACCVLLLVASFAGNMHAAEAPLATPTTGVIAACMVTVPTGDYALVTLDFSVKGAPKLYETWTCMGGLRGGRMRMDDGISLREPGGWLELKDGKLSGTFRRKNSLSTSSTSLNAVPPTTLLPS